jgi:hypothetical protein
MSDFPFKKVFWPAALTTGAVFAALTAPMFVFAAQPVKVQVLGAALPGEQVKDYASPYMGIAGVVSAGIGVSGALALGLRRSMKQSDSIDAEREILQSQMDERNVFLQQMLSSDTYLAKSGLNFFLDDEVTVLQRSELQRSESAPSPQLLAEEFPNLDVAPVVATAVSQVVPFDSTALRLDDLSGLEAFLLDDEVALAQSRQQELPAVPADFLAAVPESQVDPVIAVLPTVEPQIASQVEALPVVAPAVLAPVQTLVGPRPAPFMVVSSSPMEPVVVQAPPKPVTAQAAVVPLTAAQGFLSYSRFSSSSPTGQAPWNPVMAAQEQEALAKIQALQTQLQQIVVQIETLQTNLQIEVQTAPTQAWAAAAPQRVSPAELNWNNRQIAS